jgi:SAM-dependent methyltransferase
MFEFHKNKPKYFEHQYLTARDHILPFIEKDVALNEHTRVLEIGCAEAGVLKAFVERGCMCVGIELRERRVELAKSFQPEAVEAGQLRFIVSDIYDIDVEKDLDDLFDLIVLKDVIEHIHEQEKIMVELKRFLKPGGTIFFGFPPWYMPYGGHQQVCRNKIAARLPYYHLLPVFLYRFMLKLFGEDEQKQASLLEIKETGISIERFERICKDLNYTVCRKQYWFFNPIYRFKFGLKPRRQWKPLTYIPWFRDFVTTAVYYNIKA